MTSLNLVHSSLCRGGLIWTNVVILFMNIQTYHRIAVCRSPDSMLCTNLRTLNEFLTSEVLYIYTHTDTHIHTHTHKIKNLIYHKVREREFESNTKVVPFSSFSMALNVLFTASLLYRRWLYLS